MITRSEKWLSARVGDEVMMMSAEHGRYIGLTETGARIWDLLAEPRTAADLCDALCSEYEISAGACRNEVDAFLHTMELQGAVVIDAQ